MAGENSGPGWRGKAGAKSTSSNPNWRKAPAASGAGSSRTLKLLALGGCAVAVLVGVVVLLQYLAKSQRAGLVAIAGDPASAARLDVPYDPAGWLSAARLLEAVAANPDGKAIGTVPGGDRPFALDDDLWVEAARRDPKVDPVVVYVGLAGGVNRQGEAVLYPGRADRPTLRVVDLVEKLKAAAAAKRVVLVLDVGRQLPDPNLGEVRADFPRAVLEDKGLADALAASPAVALVLATGDESRAWDSPERGLTMLAAALRDGLLGGAGREDYSSFGVLDLFNRVKADVKRASENERPAAQVPVLLPPEAQFADGERARLFGERPFYKPPARQFDRPPAALEPPDALKEFWDEQQKLARPTTRPAPWVDTPAAWRRYRELGLRFEQAAVAGDAEGQAVLAAALKVEKGRVEAGNGVPLKESGLHALPLLGALGRPSPAAGRWAACLQGAASLPAFVMKLEEADDFKVRPPTEAHLPLMLHHFATEVVPPGVAPSLEATWKPAVACRRLAEQAALSSPDGLTGHPYSERVWPAVRAAVLAADEARRRGEDRMLAVAPDDKSKTAAQEFEEALAGYRAATERAGLIQRALATRDESFADLPFLGRWAGEAESLADAGGDPAALAGEVEAAWKAAHALAEAIDKALPAGDAKAVAPLAAATQKAATATQRLRTLAAAEARVANRNKTQTNWLALQNLAGLPVPLAGPAERAANYQSARGMAAEFLATVSQVADKGPPAAGKTPAATEAAKAARRLRIAVASLGVAPATPAADRPLATPKDSGEVAAVALEQRVREANFQANDRPDEAEALSRLAAPLRATEEYEPAASNARRRWAVLLDGLARRAALDHWFNKDNQPYLTKFAQDYLDDAERLRDPAKPAPKSADAADASKLIAAAKAPDWRYEAAAGDRLSDWTTEADNRFTYRFELGGYEKLLPAEAVVWASLSGGELLTIDAASTRPRPVSWQAAPDQRVATVAAACAVPLERRGGATVLTATAYFRGRKVPQAQPIAFNGRPHVVQTDLQPPPRAAVAVRADVDPGAVAVLIDYSGSMSDPWGQGGTKKKSEIVVELLRDLLPKLPERTRLSVRLMRVDPAAKTDSRRIFPSVGREGTKVLTKEDIEEVLSTLTDKANSPDGATPLVATMELALGDFPPNFEGVKTLIVVTDGADTSRIKDVAPNGQQYMKVEEMSEPMKAELTRLVSGDVARKFGAADAAVQMVVFGAGDAELKLAGDMFAPLERFDDANRGRVIVAKDEVSLRKELLDALRPRVKLLVANQAVAKGKFPNDVPRIGIPADPAADAVIWRGRLDPQSYALKYLNSKHELQLGRGDAVAVRLRKAEGESKYGFERECYYRDVRGKRPKVAGDRAAEGGGFFAHVPNFGVGNPGSELSYLAAVASVDRVGPSLNPGPDGGALSLANPHALWWEVRRGPAGAKDDVRYDKPLSVWNAFGLAAPSWRLVTDGVRDSAELSKGAPFRLAVWPLGQQPASLGRVSFENSDLTEGAAKSLGGVRVRARLEEFAFLGSKYPNVAEQGPFPAALAAKPQRCLVLRVDGDKGGRLLRAKVAWENDTSVAARQHLYYFRDPTQTAERAEVKAYTVVVGPVTDDFVAGKRGAEVELLDLGEALRQTPSRRMEIDLGRPPDDDRPALDALPFKLEP